MKSLKSVSVFCLLTSKIFASAGFFDRYLITNNGGSNIYTQGTTSTQNLGSFNATTQSLILKGGQSKTYKNNSLNGGGNICGPTMYYRVYKTTDSPGAFLTLVEPFVSESFTSTSVDQVWESTALSTNLISGQYSGNYILEVKWISMGSQTSTSGACDQEISDTNSENNFKFAFTITNSPLPVVLKSFSAKSQSKESLLNWKTTSERNNDRFDIQRSSDAKNWEIIAAIKGKGTIENEEHYEYQDKNPNLGVNYYRLKQVDFDGSFEYSKIVQTRILENANFNVFPNPSNGNINVSGIETSTFLKIFNSQGVEILKREVSENQSLENIPTGKYFLQISNGIEKQSKTLIVN